METPSQSSKPTLTPYSESSTLHWGQKQITTTMLCSPLLSVSLQTLCSTSSLILLAKNLPCVPCRTTKQSGVFPPEAMWGLLQAWTASCFSKFYTENPQKGELLLLQFVSRNLFSQSWDCGFPITWLPRNLSRYWSLVSRKCRKSASWFPYAIWCHLM